MLLLTGASGQHCFIAITFSVDLMDESPPKPACAAPGGCPPKHPLLQPGPSAAGGQATTPSSPSQGCERAHKDTCRTHTSGMCRHTTPHPCSPAATPLPSPHLHLSLLFLATSPHPPHILILPLFPSPNTSNLPLNFPAPEEQQVWGPPALQGPGQRLQAEPGAEETQGCSRRELCSLPARLITLY